ncbi:MAG: alpha/beta fold hydrolase [Candidatus Lokiarchaeota archaeon]|nr:alpha/beta fold hydrolase [Candidatus Lokiarchaeota archaeon]
MREKIKQLREEFNDPHYLVATSDDKSLFLREWSPAKPSDIVILIFHGITAHSGPYAEMAKIFNNHGYSVLGLDLRGHGLSDGNRGDYPSKERLLKDLEEVIQFVKTKFSRIILLGHSLGVITSLIASYEWMDQIDGLILLSAGKEVRPGVYKKISLMKKLKIVFSSLLNPNKPVIHYYREGMLGLDDPLFNFNYTFRFMRIFDAKKLELSKKIHLPIIHGIGENDELFSIESAQELFNQITTDDKVFFIMKGAKHALGFSEKSLDDLINWMKIKFKL